jgi:hypothetical protein
MIFAILVVLTVFQEVVHVKTMNIIVAKNWMSLDYETR